MLYPETRWAKLGLAHEDAVEQFLTQHYQLSVMKFGQNEWPLQVREILQKDGHPGIRHTPDFLVWNYQKFLRQNIRYGNIWLIDTITSEECNKQSANYAVNLKKLNALKLFELAYGLDILLMWYDMRVTYVRDIYTEGKRRNVTYKYSRQNSGETSGYYLLPKEESYHADDVFL